MSDTIDEATAAETPATEVATKPSQDQAGSDAASTDGAPRRRRRRGGRGRRGSGSSKKPATEGASEDSTDADAAVAVEAQSESVTETGTADAADEGSELAANGAPRPARRRRGGRGRGRSKTTEASGDAEPEVGGTDAETAEAPSDEADATTTTDPEAAPKRRRSRGGRRRSTAAKKERGEAEREDSPAGDTTDAEEKPKPRRRRSTKTDADKPAAAPTKAKAKPAAKDDAKPATRRRTREPVGTSGPTRLRRGRTGIRRRREPTPVISQDEDMVMVLTENGDRDQIAVLEGRDLVQHYVTRQGARSMVGNVYLGRVQNVLPGMEAAFVDIGRGRNAVLYAGEVNYSDEDLEGPAPRIEQVLKSGQSILVQVTKDPMGGKGSRLTAQ